MHIILNPIEIFFLCKNTFVQFFILSFSFFWCYGTTIKDMSRTCQYRPPPENHFFNKKNNGNYVLKPQKPDNGGGALFRHSEWIGFSYPLGL